MKVLSAQQMRDLEQTAVDNGATYIKLMEKAGTAAAEALIKYGTEGKKVVIICGKGNNGGDGYVIGRVLKKYNCKVDIIRLGEPRTTDSKLNAEKAIKLDIAMVNFPEDKETAFEGRHSSRRRTCGRCRWPASCRRRPVPGHQPEYAGDA